MWASRVRYAIIFLAFVNIIYCSALKLASIDKTYKKGLDAYAGERWSECIAKFEETLHFMHLGVNISNALQQLESVKAAVDQNDDPKLKAATSDDLNMLINLLESPILRSIATLHDSVAMLATQVAHHPSMLPGDFDITPAGDLALQTRNLYGSHEGEEEQRVPQVSPPNSLEFGSNSDNERILGLDTVSVDSSMSPKQNRGILDLSRNDDSLASASTNIVAGDWAQVEIINLVNDGTGLGFGIIGARTSGVIVKTILAGGVADRDGRLKSGDHILQIGDVSIIGARTSGVIVKTILAGGVADRDGRLKSGDHILQIGDVSLMEMGSEQVAGVLRASGSRVRLVVARAVDPAAVQPSIAPIVPARLLSNPEALDRYLLDTGFEQVFNTQPALVPPNPAPNRFVFGSSVTPPPDSDAESPEVDRFTVQLKKDENGLGITIAGYVCEKEELSGIFVKSVSAGSAAALSGAVRVNDRIVAVDGVSLAGKSNQRAVDALKQSGNVVTLQLERYLRGEKFEQLQQAIAAGESAASAAPHNPFLHMHRPDPRHAPHPPHVHGHDLPMMHLHSSSEPNEEEIVEPAAAPRTPTPQPAFEMPRTNEQKEAIRRKWQAILGEDVEIVVGVVVRGCGGLGISLEGTVDVEGGREVRPHHYVRSVLPEGPVGRAGVHRPGDELLEVNGHRLLGMNHLEVVSILKELSSEVCMVCARPRAAPAPAPALAPHHALDLAPPAHTLVKAKSDGSLAGAGGEEGGALAAGKARSRSLEPLTGLAMWASEPQIIGEDVEIVVGVVVRGCGGLGISLEGTVDVEGGREVRPHHYVRSVLPEGPVGRAGVHRPGDELLEVNGHRLLGMNHLEVVSILKELSSEVCMVCARPRAAPAPAPAPAPHHALDPSPHAHTLVKAKSDGSLAGAGGEEGGALAAGKARSRSLEPLTGLAMWASEPQIIELVKGERGLGFSILDYQDPLRPAATLVVIRSLVPGGVAQQDGRLIPGDRLLFVNDQNLEDASLEQAVAALKGAPRGLVRIGVAKPLPLADAPPPLPASAPPAPAAPATPAPDTD
ncbi:Patj-like [Papilio machaon]|uniref:Patj-like n=1 Tax=Papilio machaon TaxID=76193 RepID=A0A194QVL6_PAPMA|nr:Patj-like [Papilio machaon]